MNLLNIAFGIDINIEYEDCDGSANKERHVITLTEKPSLYDDFHVTETIGITSDLLEDLELNLLNIVSVITAYRKKHLPETF